MGCDRHCPRVEGRFRNVDELFVQKDEARGFPVCVRDNCHIIVIFVREVYF